MTIEKEINDCITKWAQEHNVDCHSLHIFGSLLYLNGARFGSSSDIDMIVTIDRHMEKPIERFYFLCELAQKKPDLEIQTIRALARAMQNEPVVSLVPTTELDHLWDIHKSNIPEFFSQNMFLNLGSQARTQGILAGNEPINPGRLIVGCLSTIQKYRHAFCHLMANGQNETLREYSGLDPIPKDLMRAAAMARCSDMKNPEIGEEYDLRAGLEHIHALIRSYEDDDKAYHELSELVSTRRMARGKGGPLTPEHQLLIAEIIGQQFFLGRNNITGNTAPIPIKIDQEAQTNPAANDLLDKAQAVNFGFQQKSGAMEKSDGYQETPELPELELPKFNERNSLIFFDARFRDAFPGMREPSVIEGVDGVARLTALLQEPIKFSNFSPIWWWRGGNLGIDNFEELASDIVLMNHDELKIEKVIPCYSMSYKRHFVYVRCFPMEPTGLYSVSDEPSEYYKHHGYDYEEYGITENGHLLTRAQHDDGGFYSEEERRLIRTESELRIRYTSSYNFIIAPSESPINNLDFDRKLVAILNRAFEDEFDDLAVVQLLANEVAKLPLNRTFDEHLNVN